MLFKLWPPELSACPGWGWKMFDIWSVFCLGKFSSWKLHTCSQLNRRWCNHNGWKFTVKKSNLVTCFLVHNFWFRLVSRPAGECTRANFLSSWWHEKSCHCVFCKFYESMWFEKLISLVRSANCNVIFFFRRPSFFCVVWNLQTEVSCAASLRVARPNLLYIWMNSSFSTCKNCSKSLLGEESHCNDSGHSYFCFVFP